MPDWNELKATLAELNTLSLFVRLFLAAIFGAIVGMDRARKRRAAGFRTHMLVCIGAALVMITNQYIVNIYGGDPARMGAQVISGIGFLGAGSIIVTRRNQIMGLTTAAGLWISACIGLTIGIGFYSAAIIGGVFIFFIVVVLQGIDDAVRKNSKTMHVYAEFVTPSDLSRLLSFSANSGIVVHEVEMVQARNSGEHLGAMIVLKLPAKAPHGDVVEELQKVEGVVFLNEI